ARRRHGARVVEDRVGPEPDVVQVGVLVELPDRSRGVLDELDVRFVDRVAQPERVEDLAVLPVEGLDAPPLHDRTPADAEQFGEVLARRLDLGDDDADVVEARAQGHRPRLCTVQNVGVHRSAPSSDRTPDRLWTGPAGPLWGLHQVAGAVGYEHTF